MKYIIKIEDTTAKDQPTVKVTINSKTSHRKEDVNAALASKLTNSVSLFLRLMNSPLASTTSNVVVALSDALTAQEKREAANESAGVPSTNR